MHHHCLSIIHEIGDIPSLLPSCDVEVFVCHLHTEVQLDWNPRSNDLDAKAQAWITSSVATSLDSLIELLLYRSNLLILWRLKLYISYELFGSSDRE